MAGNGNSKKKQAIEGEVIPASPSPPARIRLSTVRDCRREMAKLFTEARHGKLPTAEAGRLIWMLQAIVGVIRDSEWEKRIAALEAASDKDNQ